mgnify:CR=1 FL=1
MNRFNSLAQWLSWQESLHPLTIDLGLERVKRVFEKLLPKGYYQPITLTVAGTNGKGSSVAYLEAFYLAEGHSVGAYTSPHILRYSERIKINGIPVSDDVICAAFSDIDRARGDTTLSYFEFSTLAALLIFSQARVAIQILEVGLGGRLDAVNIVDADVAIVTSIAIDHVEWLGKTREKIGYEKAGVFRPHKPAIIGEPSPPDALINYAASIQADVFCINEAFGYVKKTPTWTWQSEHDEIADLPAPALKGEHQYRNAASAIFATHCLKSHLSMSDNAIRMGLQQVKLAGRFQLIEGDIPILLDVGHNPQAVETLVAYLNEYFPNTHIHAIFSMMKDKDIAGVLSLMKPIVSQWFFTPLTHNARAVTESTMRTIFDDCQIQTGHWGFSGFAQAFHAAKNTARAGDLILVFGSFFLVSDCCINLKIGEIKHEH